MESIWRWMTSQGTAFLMIEATFFLTFLLLFLENRRCHRLEERMKAYESGSLNRTVEKKIEEVEKELYQLRKEVETEKHRVNRFMAKERKAIKKVKLMKYDAFETQAGKISYALAMLNEENSGILINSIHSTDFSYSYAKEVIRGKVNQEMSKEERAILEKAVSERDRLSNK